MRDIWFRRTLLFRAAFLLHDRSNPVRLIFFFSLFSKEFGHFCAFEFHLIHSNLIDDRCVCYRLLAQRVYARAYGRLTGESARIAAALMLGGLLDYGVNKAVFWHLLMTIRVGIIFL